MTTNQIWDQTVFPEGANEARDYFGYSLAAGDFSNDGNGDLAIGTPNEDIGTGQYDFDMGTVNVIYGSTSGLDRDDSQLWLQDDLSGSFTERFDYFGHSLAAGDFDSDGYDDLVIGTPYEHIGATIYSGIVEIIYGTSGGLNSADNQFWNQTAFPSEEDEALDYFGWSLAPGDYDGDGYDDLAIGAPGEGFGTIGLTPSGQVNVLYGSLSGLTSSGSQSWDQNALVPGNNYASDYFGGSLAAGDYDGDGYDDLAISAVGKDTGGVTDAGKVDVLYGSSSGLTSNGNQIWTQDELTGSPREAYDGFGQVLAVGDFNNDGYDDLAVGTPNEDINTLTKAGTVNIIYGSSSGLTSNGNQFWHQDTTGVGEIAEAFDNFGASLAVHDFDGDGYDDLAIGVPGENIGSITDSGVVQILYGSSSGLIV